NSVSGWGVGWCQFRDRQHRVVGHDGAAIGQYAFARVNRDTGFGLALLTNGGRGGDLLTSLSAVFPDLPVPAEPTPPTAEVDTARWAGRYHRRGTTLELTPTASSCRAVASLR